ncbi:MAG: phage tail sheath C-terminal domain-containing protein [Sedimenticola sp.]
MINPAYPGVYIQELDSGVRTVSGVPTSIAAFVGRAKRGPVNQPVSCFNFGEFSRRFGGLWTNSTLSYCVDDFYANGGGQCAIVRLFKPKAASDGYAKLTIGALKLIASSPGSWGNGLSGKALHPTTFDPVGAKAAAAKYGLDEDDLFDLIIEESATGASEVYRNLTVRSDGGERRFDRVFAAQSSLVTAKFDNNGDPILGSRPAHDAEGKAQDGDDGDALDDAAYIGSEDEKTGIYALKKADIFNLLCIPPEQRDGTIGDTVRAAAAKFAKESRSLFIVDPPAAWDAKPDSAAAEVKKAQLAKPLVDLSTADYAAVYFPRLKKADKLRSGQIDIFPPCGAVAGVIARTDVERGIWKAPAGIGASIAGIDALTVRMTDGENGLLNPLGINCLRSLPNIGQVVWGARTAKGSDQLSDDYKYVSVRRLALYIEESLFRGTQWVVFEGNDEPLWTQIRLSVGAFMQRLFQQGAFQGTSPREAYFIKCDSETTTQDDINRGIVNILVGFAPLQPAEFVIISIQQIRSAS